MKIPMEVGWVTSKYRRSRLTERCFGLPVSGLYIGCACKGCRAPEMAAGSLLQFAERLSRLCDLAMVQKSELFCLRIHTLRLISGAMRQAGYKSLGNYLSFACKNNSKASLFPWNCGHACIVQSDHELQRRFCSIFMRWPSKILLKKFLSLRLARVLHLPPY